MHMSLLYSFFCLPFKFVFPVAGPREPLIELARCCNPTPASEFAKFRFCSSFRVFGLGKQTEHHSHTWRLRPDNHFCWKLSSFCSIAKVCILMRSTLMHSLEASLPAKRRCSEGMTIQGGKNTTNQLCLQAAWRFTHWKISSFSQK